MDEDDIGLWSEYAEQGIFGAIIVDAMSPPREAAERFAEVAKVLTEQDFYSGRHRLLWRAVSAMWAKGIAPDPILLSEALERRDQLEDAGGFVYISTMARNTPSVENLRAYAQAVRSLSVRRQLAAAGAAILRIAREPGDSSAEERTAQAVQTILAVSKAAQSGGRKEVFDMPALLGLLIEHLQEAEEARKKDGTIGATTGIAALDEATGGLVDSDLIVVGARQGMGKTAIGLSMAWSQIRAGLKVGFVSTEMSPKQLIQRLASLQTDVEAVKLRDATLTEMETTRLVGAVPVMRDYPLQVYDKPTCTIADIHIQARMWKAEYGLDVIIIDFLQRLQIPEGHNSRVRALGEAAQSLKSLARELDIPVVLLSQINRNPAQRADKRPTQDDLRDSGEIAEAADLVLLPFRPGVYDSTADPGMAEIIIDKNRHGPCETILARWDGPTMRWSGREAEPYEERGEGW